MADKRPPEKDTSGDFDARLKAARQRHPKESENESRDEEGRSKSGMGLAFRIGTELVAAIVFGAFLGYLLDQWLGTSPWMIILFFFLGFAAGMLNVYRVVSGYGLGVGYIKPGNAKDEKKDGKD